jgi:hypothetical protein
MLRSVSCDLDACCSINSLVLVFLTYENLLFCKVSLIVNLMYLIPKHFGPRFYC